MPKNSLILDKENFTIDSFCRGKFYLIQPKNIGHRSGLDAMLLASCVPNNFCGKIADFGSGSGAAGIAALMRSANAHLTLIDNSDLMINCAKQNLTLAENYYFARNVDIIKADLSYNCPKLRQQGITENLFDFVIMNPPFNNAKSQVSKDILRAQAHVKSQNLLQDWIKIACFSLKAKGRIAIIISCENISEILPILTPRFGAIQICPIYPTPKKQALRLIIMAQKNRQTAISLLPPLYIRLFSDNQQLIMNPAIENICNARITIFDAINSPNLNLS